MSSRKIKQEFSINKKAYKAKQETNKNDEFKDGFYDIENNFFNFENNFADFDTNNDNTTRMQINIQKKIEEQQQGEKIFEINTDFLKAFSHSNFFYWDDKDDNNNKQNLIEDNSKNSTNSELTNDDSFEREISDEEIGIKREFINRKRIRNTRK